ncbi:hypothetical protein TrLO_g10455 [Triparma laevis f. longispina]|uniref:Uncharacterized protein n=1 Tax=Triparma laevis f. longispina TaxID=1714387 RepID=A0A9W7C8S3_9STRA|nr:hypothetical protein TrLO_g10455 [Triparma laevis f. longispina]
MLSLLLSAFLLLTLASSFTLNPSFPHSNSSPSLKTKYSSTALQVRNHPVSRTAFLSQFGYASTLGLLTSVLTDVKPAYAGGEEKLKGTKADPKYTNCVSECVFECTKEKGVEQKTRVECIPGCKEKCASSKAQLMLGTPK